MAKKKKSHKKHQQHKYAAPTTPTGNAQPAATVSVVAAAKAVNLPSMSYEVANLALIKRDVRKVIMLAGSFVALQIVLWVLFEHTSLGSTVYHLIKL